MLRTSWAQLVAYVVRSGHGIASMPELRAYIGQRLPDGTASLCSRRVVDSLPGRPTASWTARGFPRRRRRCRPDRRSADRPRSLIAGPAPVVR
jgi:hypothetical protein